MVPKASRIGSENMAGPASSLRRAATPVSHYAPAKHGSRRHNAYAKSHAFSREGTGCRFLSRAFDVLRANSHSNRSPDQMLHSGYLDRCLQLPRCDGWAWVLE